MNNATRGVWRPTRHTGKLYTYVLEYTLYPIL